MILPMTLAFVEKLTVFSVESTRNPIYRQRLETDVIAFDFGLTILKYNEFFQNIFAYMPCL